MTELEQLEQEVQSLSQSDFEKFRDWFMEFEWEKWDERIEKDLKSGRLDQLISEAKAEFKAGKTQEL